MDGFSQRVESVAHFFFFCFLNEDFFVPAPSDRRLSDQKAPDIGADSASCVSLLYGRAAGVYHLGIHPSYPELDLLADLRAAVRAAAGEGGVLSVEPFTEADTQLARPRTTPPSPRPLLPSPLSFYQTPSTILAMKESFAACGRPLPPTAEPVGARKADGRNRRLLAERERGSLDGEGTQPKTKTGPSLTSPCLAPRAESRLCLSGTRHLMPDGSILLQKKQCSDSAHRVGENRFLSLLPSGWGG